MLSRLTGARQSAEPAPDYDIAVSILVVDVANVCLDGSLPGFVSLSRLELVLDAWRQQICQYVEVLLVVDKSLLRKLPPADRQRVKRLRRQGSLWIRSRDADDLLLDMAEDKGGCVLSKDRFLDKRRGRRWNEDRFYSWSMRGNAIRVGRRPSQNTQPYDISRKEEQKLARLRGIDDLRHPALRRRWACVSEAACETRDATPEFLEVLPALDHITPVCPGCGHPLEDRGTRPNRAELKLVFDEVELARFSLTQGETIPFGRTMMPQSGKVVALGRKGKLSDIGREHVHVRLVGKRVAARPADDGHPVWVHRWDSDRRRFDRRVQLHPGRFTAVGLRDILLVGERLELHRSGRSIVEAQSLGDPEADESWQAWRTDK